MLSYWWPFQCPTFQLLKSVKLTWRTREPLRQEHQRHLVYVYEIMHSNKFPENMQCLLGYFFSRP